MPHAGQMGALDLGEQQHARRHQRMRPVVTGKSPLRCRWRNKPCGSQPGIISNTISRWFGRTGSSSKITPGINWIPPSLPLVHTAAESWHCRRGKSSPARFGGGIAGSPGAQLGRRQLCQAQWEPADTLSFYHSHWALLLHSTRVASSCLVLIKSRTITLNQKARLMAAADCPSHAPHTAQFTPPPLTLCSGQRGNNRGIIVSL